MSNPLTLFNADAGRAMADWSPATSWQTGVYRDGSFTRFPQPVTLIVWENRWDFTRTKSAGTPGDTTTNTSINGVDITIRGRLAATEWLDALDVLAALWAVLDTTGTGDTFDVYLHYDATANDYRSFRQCIAERIQFDISDAGQFEYIIEIHADNPVLDETAP